MTIKIDKDVPMPANAGSKSHVYPFQNMEVGDSFFAAGKTGDQLTNAAAHYRKRNSWGFSCRNTVENEVKGARIWRIK